VLVLGITGSVAMGKTTVARVFARAGYPVFDADAAVRALLTGDKATIAAVRRAFPDATRAGRVDRKALAALVFDDARALARLEKLLHPRVRRAERAFLKKAKARGARLAVLDIPLLFETGAERRVDAVLVVFAPASVQKARVLARPGMSLGRFRAMRSRQMSDREKRRRATFVLDTSAGRAKMTREIRRVIAMLDPRSDRNCFARDRP
jgi:dephospho-CoA kinase